jgi:hypothetical protein
MFSEEDCQFVDGMIKMSMAGKRFHIHLRNNTLPGPGST